MSFLFLKIVFNHEPENHQFAYTGEPMSSRDLVVSHLPTLYFLPISWIMTSFWTWLLFGCWGLELKSS